MEDFHKLLSEDPWIKSESGRHFLAPRTSGDLGNKIYLSYIKTAELDTVEFPDSPGLHVHLGSLYLEIEKELPFQIRKQIELEKLRITDTTKLDDFLKGDVRFVDYVEVSMDPDATREQISDLEVYTGPGVFDHLVKMPLYTTCFSVGMRIETPNTQRGLEYITESLSLIKDRHPVTFERFVEPRAQEVLKVLFSSHLQMGKIVVNKLLSEENTMKSTDNDKPFLPEYILFHDPMVKEYAKARKRLNLN
jgi:hypothetical protein